MIDDSYILSSTMKYIYHQAKSVIVDFSSHDVTVYTNPLISLYH